MSVDLRDLATGGYHLNAFRVLGLPASAAAAEVEGAASALRRHLKLGIQPAGAALPAGLVAVPTTERAAVEAVARLDRPIARLWDRLFWFEGRDGLHDATLGAWVRLAGRDGGLIELRAWGESLAGWRALAQDEAYWQALAAVEATAGFQPPADARELAEVREQLLVRVLEPLAMLARSDWLEPGGGDLARRALTLLGRQEARLAEKLMEEVLAPAEKQLVGLCDELAGAIATGQALDASRTAEARIQAELAPRLTRFLDAVGKHAERGAALRMRVAQLYYELAWRYSEADQWSSAERWIAQAVELAPAGTQRRLELERDLRDIRQNLADLGARREAAAPRPSAVLGFGTGLFALDRYDDASGSYVATLYFTIAFLPAWPLARHRYAEGRRYLGRAPRQVEDFLPSFGLLALLALLVAAL